MPMKSNEVILGTPGVAAAHMVGTTQAGARAACGCVAGW